MTSPTLDIIAILKRELPVHGVPAATLSVVAEISPSRLSSYLNGTARCPNEHDVRLRTAWARVKKMIAFAAPLRLDFRKADDLKNCIALMESGELHIAVYTQQQ